MPFDKLLQIIKNVHAVYGEKIWLNLGILKEEELQQCRPYVKGICSSMETLNPKLHDIVCPSKPILPYDEMFSTLNGFRKSICIIVGLGESIDNIDSLFDFIEKHELERITVYALKPVRNTDFTQGPTTDELLQWLARIRIRFPKLEIIAGTNLRRHEEVGLLMRAGANAVTKFPATKEFGSEKAKLVEKLIMDEKREFVGNLTDCSGIDWEEEIEKLLIEEKYKKEMREKLGLYRKNFK